MQWQILFNIEEMIRLNGYAVNVKEKRSVYVPTYSRRMTSEKNQQHHLQLQLGHH